MSNANYIGQRTLTGITLMMAAQVFFIGTDTSAKWLTVIGTPVLQIVFVRYLVHFLASVIYYMPARGFSIFATAYPGKQFLRSSCLLCATIANVVALKFLPITVTTTVSFAGPILVTVLAVPLLKEHVDVARILAVCLGFLGVLIVFQPWGGDFHPALLLSLCVMACGSLYYILTRMLSGVDGMAAMQCWSSALGVVLLLPLAATFSAWPATLYEWVILVLVGIFGAIAHTLVAAAHRFTEASVLAPIVYTQIVFATLSSILIFGTWPSAATSIGGGFIVLSGAWVLQQARHRRARPPKIRVSEPT
ncbi:DMT family transporter [Neorhizobium lilium]|uniref:DMT family transporter n=1 Tax=Neorhizobium lilium TaxID=2503024 RepID=A0A3S3RG43_9HYPH|nr:DMT family transporter [Neorhizobium lilium]RWX74841.1 DMT family transporter [Neorhizobium lilium]